MIRVLLNGELRETGAATVFGLVEELGLPGPLLLIEKNGEALRKADWSAQVLQDGDRVEVLRVSAGG